MSEIERTEELVKLRERLNELQREAEDLSREELAQKKRIADIEGNRMEGLKAQKQIAKSLMEDLDAAFTRGDDEGVQAFGEMQQALKNIGIEAEDSAEAMLKLKVRTAELDKSTSKMAKAGDKAGQQFFGGIASHLGMASKAGGDFITRLRVMTENMKDPEFRGNFANQFKQIFTLSNMASAGIMAVAQASIMLATQADKATAAFAKQTGTGTTHRASITNLSAEYREFGVTTEDASKTIGALFNNMPGYTQMAGEQQRAFERTVATLDKLGVAVEDSTALMNDLMKGQKMSAEMAIQQAQELALTAESLQMTAGSFTKQFIEARKVLAPYGRESVKVFTNIASAAQAAGVETASLLNLAGKFDTFNDSAEAAGKLNAILGTQLSATELLTMSEDKRIETLIRSMQSQGKSFKDMDRFTQKAVAQTLGIQDLSEAQKILGMDVAGFRNYQANAAAAAKEQEDMEKKAQAAMDSMQKLKMAFANLATQLMPLITAFQTFAQLVLDVSEGIGGTETLGYVLGFMALLKVMGPLIGILKFMPFSLNLFSAGAAGAGSAAGAATPAVAGLSAAISGITLPILGIAVALTLMLGLFVLLIMTLIDAGEAGMQAGIAILAVSLSVYALSASLALLGTIGAIGGAVLAGLIALFVTMALATASAGEGIASAFKELNNFVKGGGDISKISSALNELGNAFRNLNVGMRGGGLIQKGLAFVGLGGGTPKKTPIAQMVEDMEPLIEKADQLSTVFAGLSELFKLAQGGVGSVFVEMATALDTLFASVDKSTEKGVQVTHTLENLALITSGTSAQANGFKGVIGAINKMVGSNQMTLNVKLDKKSLEDLAAGRIAKVVVGG
jgi:hypothetical protein